MLDRSLVINCTSKSVLNWLLSFLEMYPRSANSLPNRSCTRPGTGWRSSTLPGGYGHVKQLASIIEDHMQLESEKPTGRTFAPLGYPSKESVLMPTTRMAYGQRRRVDKRNTRAGSLALAQIGA